MAEAAEGCLSGAETDTRPPFLAADVIAKSSRLHRKRCCAFGKCRRSLTARVSSKGGAFLPRPYRRRCMGVFRKGRCDGPRRHVLERELSIYRQRIPAALAVDVLHAPRTPSWRGEVTTISIECLLSGIGSFANSVRVRMAGTSPVMTGLESRSFRRLAEDGGSVNSAIAWVNEAIERTMDKTILVPGHGPVGNHAQLIEFRDMLVTVRDKIIALESKGISLEAIIAAKPTAASTIDGEVL
jgi:hypothetical protein